MCHVTKTIILDRLDDPIDQQLQIESQEHSSCILFIDRQNLTKNRNSFLLACPVYK
jgi:hypothetical protein